MRSARGSLPACMYCCHFGIGGGHHDPNVFFPVTQDHRFRKAAACDDDDSGCRRECGRGLAKGKGQPSQDPDSDPEPMSADHPRYLSLDSTRAEPARFPGTVTATQRVVRPSEIASLTLF